MTVSINDDDFNHRSIKPGEKEVESLNNETKGINFEEEYFTEAKYPVKIKANFSTLSSFMKTSPKHTGSQSAFTLDESLGKILGFKLKVIHEK